MKRFCVSDKCIACGECIVRTDQLVETPDGHAAPANNAYIDDTFLAEAKEIVKMCPVDALDIYEYCSTTFSGIAGAEELAGVLEQRLKNVQIPEISSRDIAFNAKDYPVSYGYAEGEYDFRYSSESSAKQAANRAFETTFWNHRADYVLSLLTQYKSKILRPYYDFEAKDNFFLGLIDQFQTILYDILCEAKSLTDGSITLSENSFCAFSPDLSEVKKYTKENIASMESQYLVKQLLEALGREAYYRLSDYESHFYIESRSEVIGQNWLGNKVKWTYSFEGVNAEGKDLVEDVKFALEHSECYGTRYVNELAAEKINFGTYLFTSAINAEIRKKVTDYRNALEKLKSSQ